MREFVIFGDSTCDLEKDLREQYDLDYIPMNYIIDGEEYVASLDWEYHSVHEFYDIMRGGKRVFTTQIPQTVCREKFRGALENGKDVLYISCSSKLSSSYDTACVIARELMQEYPEGKICCVDSLISTFGQGHLLMEASRLRKEGKSLEEAVAYVEELRMRMNMTATPGSLEYLRRAGRVKASSAFFGNLFGVKPILISDRIGQNYAVKKVKGALNARNAVAEMTVEAMTQESQTLYIVHTDCLEAAQALRDEICQRASFQDVRIGNIGPIVGASVGPGLIGAIICGKEVTIEGTD